ncbi:MAG: hypothetical protein CV088_03110 [Nitrospira sp. LK70]|nr:hypothetical protein [Nitrospira sp. LK70]
MNNIEPYRSHFMGDATLYMDHVVSRSSPAPRADHLRSQDAVEASQQMVRAGQQFEAYFISYLLKVMRETVPEGTVANKQGAYFYSFYDEEIGRRAAESGGIGIARMVQDYAQQHFVSSSLEHSSSLG